MKNATFSFTAALCAALALAFTACNNDDPAPAAPPLQAVTFRNLAADPIVSSGTGQPPAATGRFTLFSFGTGQIVPNADSASTQWDIGFRATRIIFNGGGSGPGQAAVSLQTGLFDEIRTVSDTMTFRQDAPNRPALSPVSGQGWYNYNDATRIVTPIPGRVLVVRTADGKFAKMEILSYYKDAPATPDPNSGSRHYTFRYVYQPDGSRRLE